LISGAGAGGDSAAYLARVARDAGAAPDWLLLEESAESTVDNIRNSAPMLKRLGAGRVVLVTNRGHARRAGAIATHHLAGVEVRVEVVPDADGRAGLWFRLREGAKLIVSALRGWAPLASITQID